jgi:hypothetical protein
VLEQAVHRIMYLRVGVALDRWRTHTQHTVDGAAVSTRAINRLRLWTLARACSRWGAYRERMVVLRVGAAHAVRRLVGFRLGKAWEAWVSSVRVPTRGRVMLLSLTTFSCNMGNT